MKESPDAPTPPKEIAAVHLADEDRLANLKRQVEIRDNERKLMPGFLSTWNDRVTALGAAVALLSAIMSGINAWQINRLTTREKVEQASYKFADLFVEKFLPANKPDAHPKKVQAMLAILDIVAQASSSKKGDSRAESRELLPIRLSLLLGEPGAVIELDPDGIHLDDWVNLAAADNQDETRVCAMRALAQLGKKSLVNRRLDILKKVVDKMEYLQKFTPEGSNDDTAKVDEAAKVQSSVSTARSDLAVFISNHQDDLDSASFINGNGKSSGETEARALIRKQSRHAVTNAQQARQKLQAQLLQIEGKVEATSVDLGQSQVGGPDSAPPPLAGELRQNLEKLDVVIATAENAAVRKADPSLTSDPDNISVSGPTKIVNVTKQASDLADQLDNEDPAKRQDARSKLALFGNYAVKPLLKKIGSPPSTEAQEKLNFEVALTLAQMRQPISLDKNDSAAVVGMLYSRSVNESNEASGDRAHQIRRNIAAFLMDLADGPTIRCTFAQLKSAFEKDFQENFGKNGNMDHKGFVVFNAALVVVTWARNLVPSIRSPEGDKPMRETCLETARKWRTDLAADAGKSDKWNITLSTLDDLIARARNVQTPVKSMQTPKSPPLTTAPATP